MTEQESMVLPDSPDAARLVVVRGWVSRDGRWWADDEQQARIWGATHLPCGDCGTPVAKGSYYICEPCREKREVARYAAMPRLPWDGYAMVYSQVLDRFYTSPNDALDDRESDDQTLTDLRLIICEPVRARTVDEDYWEDAMPSEADIDLPDELLEPLAALNDAIAKLPPLSWQPGRFALAT